MFPSFVSAERQTAGPEYFWDNFSRPPNETLILQQTLEGEVFFETAGIRRLVPPGRAFLFRHGEDSRYGNARKTACSLEWTALHARAGTEDLFEAIRHNFGPVITMAENGEAARILHAVVDAYEKGNRDDILSLSELCYRLLLALFREQVDDTRLSDPVAFGRHLIESRFRSAGNIKEWALETGLSREHFTREFRRRYGEPPAAYLRRLRLEHANLLARTSRMSVEELAPASGFAGVQTFRRAFRQHFGVPIGKAHKLEP